jgi:DNA-binding winged helix-turn-helix (wHTH) protein
MGSTVFALQPKEAEVLATLLEAFPRVVTIDALITSVWGHHEPESAYGCLKAHMWKLRKTMEGTGVSIATVFGTGYRVVLS